jgi:hypothetical protein
MGIFSRQQSVSAWYPDDTGVSECGDPGGDVQVGPSWGIRLRRDDKPCSIIDITYWAFADETNRGEYGVVRQVEHLVCNDPSDPWDTEVWSHGAQDDVNDLVMRRKEAIAYARTCADEDFAEGADLYGDWDGERF